MVLLTQLQDMTYGGIVIISHLFAVLIPILYFSSKKCRHHPASIILILCSKLSYPLGILEMMSTYQLFISKLNDPFLIEWFLRMQLRYLDFWSKNIWFDYDRQTNIYYRNDAIYLTCIIAELCYITVLCVDLIVTIKRPFVNSSTRILLYHVVSIFTTVVMCTLVIRSYIDITSVDQELWAYNLTIACLYFTLLFIGFFILVGLLSLYYGLTNLIIIRKINVQSQRTKNQYLINHMLMIVSIIFIWTPLNMLELSMFYKVDLEFHKYFKYGDPFLCVLLASPILFALIRMREPYFFFRIRFLFRYITGKMVQTDRQIIKSLEKSDDQNLDQWLIPLNQLFQKNQNSETVNQILISILGIVKYNQSIDFDINLKELARLARIINTSKQAARSSVPDRNINASVSDRLFDYNREQSLLMSTCDSTGFDLLEYEIQEYAPAIFQRLRELDGITEIEFLKSLDLRLNVEQIKMSQESLGRSGSFFFFSHDRRLILKTLQYSEIQTLLKTLLPHYAQYIMNKNPTLIAKIYGAFTVNIGNLSSVHLVLMEDTTSYIPFKNSSRYDLKGSIYNRYTATDIASETDIDQRSSISSIIPEDMLYLSEQQGFSTKVLKDVNFIQSNDLFVELGQEFRTELLKVIQADSNLLKQLNIMDYSLFICINNQEEGGLQAQNKFRRIQTNKQILSLSVIDILQSYNLNKWLEFQFKALQTDQPHLISSTDADHYSQRFMVFINSIFVTAKTYP